MKLARPDVFHPRIVLASCPQQAGGDSDDDGLVAALRQRGLHARWLSWDDPAAAAADLVILRATRDYADRADEFLAWATGVANLLNAPSVVAWNADRGYVADLTERKVPTVPGEVFAPGDRVRLPRRGDFFVGPATGSGTRRFSDRSDAAAHIAQLAQLGVSAFVQPCGSADNEHVLVFLGGKPSHAFPPEPDFEIWDVGAAALAAATDDPSRLLYARAHLCGARIVELQLIDPSLGFKRLDTVSRDLAQREFALNVESACERFGLGPFSHRRSH
jgi:hypothetical protein